MGLPIQPPQTQINNGGFSDEQLKLISELNRRFQEDSTSFSNDQKALIRELNRRAGIGSPQQLTGIIPNPPQSVQQQPLVTSNQNQDIDPFTNFLRSTWKSLGPNTVALYQEAIGDHDKAKETLSEAERNYPTRPGTSAEIGGITGSIIPVAAATVATIFPEPVTTAVGAAMLANYAVQGIGSGRQAVKTFEDETGQDVSPLKEGLVAAGYGASVFVAEALGLKGFKGIVNKMAPAALQRIGIALTSKSPSAVSKVFVNEITKSGFKGALTEGGEEGLEQLLTNAFDNIYTSKSLTDNIIGSSLRGAAGGFGLGPLALGVGSVGRNRSISSQEATSAIIFPDDTSQELDARETKSKLDINRATKDAGLDMVSKNEENIKNAPPAQRQAMRNFDVNPINSNLVLEAPNGKDVYTAKVSDSVVPYVVDRGSGESSIEGYAGMLRSIINDVDVSEKVKKDIGIRKYTALTESIHKTLDADVSEKQYNEFSGSSVIDNSGNLVKVYASKIGINNSVYGEIKSPYGNGYYFSDNINSIINPNSITKKDGTITAEAAVLNMNNPLLGNKVYSQQEIHNKFGDKITVTDDGLTGDRLYRDILQKNMPRQADPDFKEKAIKAIEDTQVEFRKAGFDGVMYFDKTRESNFFVVFDKKQIGTDFITLKQSKEISTKQQPQPPGSGEIVENNINDALPESVGGKKRTRSKIIPVEAEVKSIEVPNAYKEQTEEFFNSVAADIGIDRKQFDKTILSITDNFNGSKKDAKFEWWRNGLRDTALFFSKTHGKAGGRLFQHFVNGFDKHVELQKIGAAVTQKAEKIAKNVEAMHGAGGLRDSYKRIRAALEDRESAGEILQGEHEKQLYNVFQKGYDLYKEELIAQGIPVLDDYYTRVAREISIIEDIFSGDVINNPKNAAIQDALSGKVNSKFLQQRTGELKNANDNPLEVFRQYSSSVSKSLAYRPAVRYYTEKFDSDIPLINRKNKNFGIANKELVDWMKGILDNEYIYGTQSSRIFIRARANVYRSLLNFNVRAAIDNRTQRDFARAFTTKDNWPIADGLFKIRHTFESNMPNMHEVISQASKDKAYLMEMTESMLGISEDSGAIRQAWTKLKELEPFRYTEKGNWDYSEILGVVEQVRKEKIFNDSIKEGMTLTQAIEKALSDDKVKMRALVNAQALSQQTQFMPGVVASPKFFRGRLQSTILMLKRFPVSQMENMLLSFRSGSSGAAALRILRRGFDEEVQPVEELQKIETIREAIDEAIRGKRKDKTYTDVDINTMKKIRDEFVKYEKDLDGVVSKIQPINNNNKRSQVLLWSRYTGKRVANVFLFNYLSNIIADAFGIPTSDEEKKKGHAQRALESAFRNATPFYNEVADPGRLLMPPILPNTKYSVTSPGGAASILRWGFNFVPALGISDRLSGRIISRKGGEAFSSLFKDDSGPVHF